MKKSIISETQIVKAIKEYEGRHELSPTLLTQELFKNIPHIPSQELNRIIETIKVNHK